jgi:UDP-glucose 4-epimerase
LDSFTDFYPRWIKEGNIQDLGKMENFEFLEEDLNHADLDQLLKKVEYVIHLAAQAGVRSSWGDEFSVYSRNNIEVTQRLLEAARDSLTKKVIFASSSSVYGLCPDLPMKETSVLLPFSPYGVTKLAAEQLCSLYFTNYEVPTVSLRFFTVFGPGQRPDMAFHRFFRAVLEDKPITLFGDGTQTRDFSYIDDVTEATVAALEKGKAGEIYNIGGGNPTKLKDIIPMIEDITQRKLSIEWRERQKGDVLHTCAAIEKASTDLDYEPKSEIYDGLKQEWHWLRSLYST